MQASKPQRNPLILLLAGFIGLVLGISVLFVVVSSDAAQRAAAVPVPPTARHVTEPASSTPSKSAQMVCAPEAQKDIAGFIGQPTTDVTTPTWQDRLYSCRYAYADGSIGLSVKELSNKRQTTAYFSSLEARLGAQKHLKGFGQGAFVTTNGSLVLRKDNKVLLVDTSGLPSQFGSPPHAKKDVAIGVAVTVMGCWTGT